MQPKLQLKAFRVSRLRGWYLGLHEWLYCQTYLRWAVWYCARHGHRWGKSGTCYIPGEPTVHWAECARCGFSDSD